MEGLLIRIALSVLGVLFCILLIVGGFYLGVSFDYFVERLVELKGLAIY